jgi:hypothetical protein
MPNRLRNALLQTVGGARRMQAQLATAVKADPEWKEF